MNSKAALVAERVLGIVGALVLLFVGGAYGFVAYASRATATKIQMPSRSIDTANDASSTVEKRIRIPALGLDVPLAPHGTTVDLLRGAGHIDGTSEDWQHGTMAYAAHRDTYFRRLRDVRVGMTVAVSDEQGTHLYTVRGTKIVDPHDTPVLRSNAQPQLLLVTCYPFTFIGPAPKRFVVVAYPLSTSAH